MKKKISLILIMLFISVIISGCSSDISKLSKKLELVFPEIEHSQITNTHGGFHGDGKMLMKIVFKDKTLATQLEGKWSKMPLSKNLSIAVYGLEDNNETIYSLVKTEDEQNFIPKIENGYYYFYDRNSESSNPNNDNDLFTRCSYNFSVAIYDCENKTLYYADIDT